MASRANAVPWIYTDADNTLWDTNSVYAEAQLGLLKRAEQMAGRRTPSSTPLEYLRQYDQGIAKQHHSHLRYPPSLLIRALVKGLQGEPWETAVEHVLTHGSVPTEDEKCAVDTFQTDLARVPPLLPSVQEGLRVAHDCIFRCTCAVPGHAQQEFGFSETTEESDHLLRIIPALSEGREKRQELVFWLKSSGVRAERLQPIQRTLFACQIRLDIHMRRLNPFVA
jgi:hypothetical protein